MASNIGTAVDNANRDLQALDHEIKADTAGRKDINAILDRAKAKRAVLLARIKENQAFAADFDKDIGCVPFVLIKRGIPVEFQLFTRPLRTTVVESRWLRSYDGSWSLVHSPRTTVEATVSASIVACLCPAPISDVVLCFPSA
jgi:hypothetical protein